MVPRQHLREPGLLSDGTPISGLIDHDSQEIAMRVLIDPDLYQVELRHLFGRSWNVVGHVTEIPGKGDFVARYIKGPEAVEFWHWSLVERGAPPEIKDRVGRTTAQTVGSSGQIEQDDGECWPATTRAARGVYAAEQTLKCQAPRGECKPPNWPGGDIVSEGLTKDDGQWYWWQRYFDYVTGSA